MRVVKRHSACWLHRDGSRPALGLRSPSACAHAAGLPSSTNSSSRRGLRTRNDRLLVRHDRRSQPVRERVDRCGRSSNHGGGLRRCRRQRRRARGHWCGERRACWRVRGRGGRECRGRRRRCRRDRTRRFSRHRRRHGVRERRRRCWSCVAHVRSERCGVRLPYPLRSTSITRATPRLARPVRAAARRYPLVPSRGEPGGGAEPSYVGHQTRAGTSAVVPTCRPTTRPAAATSGPTADLSGRACALSARASWKRELEATARPVGPAR